MFSCTHNQLHCIRHRPVQHWAQLRWERLSQICGELVRGSATAGSRTKRSAATSLSRAPCQTRLPCSRAHMRIGMATERHQLAINKNKGGARAFRAPCVATLECGKGTALARRGLTRRLVEKRREKHVAGWYAWQQPPTTTRPYQCARMHPTLKQKARGDSGARGNRVSAALRQQRCGRDRDCRHREQRLRWQWQRRR